MCLHRGTFCERTGNIRFPLTSSFSPPNPSEHLQEVKPENKALRGTVADFERVKRAFGPEEVEGAVEDAKRREAQEQEQKKAKRKFSRGAG